MQNREELIKNRRPEEIEQMDGPIAPASFPRELAVGAGNAPAFGEQRKGAVKDSPVTSNRGDKFEGVFSHNS